MPDAAAAIDRVATGELAALQPTGKGRSYADLPFEDASGKALTLKDFSGKTLLVNFWASWCIPCRAEMPALDALAKKFDGPDFMVLPINLDAGDGGPDKARAFLTQAGVNLPLYADPSLKTLDRLKQNAVALGLPATLLLDRKACEVAVLQGPAKWDSPDGENVIKALEAVKT
jgi:thiol-disulfide isomerase/thioredoxin